jgi:uncharacterized protein YyaL (SSP411 family)
LNETKYTNRLINEKSPYLLQHAHNPVDWYPWSDEAFEKAKAYDKPIFLSIGYSTCHWCHVMAHESFEDEEIAAILNQYFISVKVDKEERPDIDSVYMTVCQAFTGSGGWPTTIFMTPDKLPFFAGTYFPKTSRHGMPGLLYLLMEIHKQWDSNRQKLISSAMDITERLQQQDKGGGKGIASELLDEAAEMFQNTFDKDHGGFGPAPKFPLPHNLLFLMDRYKKNNNLILLEMVETTLKHMYLGGLFDHIGGGFSRYSTDRYFLVPHFEKMLYDNALLITSYARAYCLTEDSLYLSIAEKTASYILKEMTGPNGEFYCAQDADSEGVEGKYYVFRPEEIINVLGKERGELFNSTYDISTKGNFEGKSIPNLLKSGPIGDDFSQELAKLYEYRKNRYKLHLDDKMLCSWNSLMISALGLLYRVTKESEYLQAAIKAQEFIESRLNMENVLYTSFREGKLGSEGFIDDYAYYIFALLSLYDATLDSNYLEKAKQLCQRTLNNFYDNKEGGFWLYGDSGEKLILRPKETYDGALPSGNSVMAYNLVRLYHITEDEAYGNLAEDQLSFMSGAADGYPAGYSFFLLALSMYEEPPERITIVLQEGDDKRRLARQMPLGAAVSVLEHPTEDFPLKNNKTTYYVCRNHACHPPVNEIKP